MERAFEADLQNATEIVLGAVRRRTESGPERLTGHHRRREGSAVAAAGAVRLGNVVGAALGGYRLLGPAEATLLLGAGAVLVAIAALALLVPWLVLAPVVVVLAWLGLVLIVDSVKARRAHGAKPEPRGDPGEGVTNPRPPTSNG
jgi:cardiolipin synthase